MHYQLLAVSALVSWLPAQLPVLAPTANVTLSSTQPLHYASIHIPVGVTVSFTGAPAVVMRCDGDAIIDGTIDVRGSTASAPGAVAIGNGTPGYACTSLSPPVGQSGAHAVHAGTYGSAMPFALDGGSDGGGVNTYVHQLSPYVPCSVYNGTVPGGRGGGTFVLRAEGVIEVRGAVRATGGGGVPVALSPPVYSGPGSGGSVLLSGMQGITIFASGVVDARGGFVTWLWPPTFQSPGYVRIEAFGTPPTIYGSVQPLPLLVELPHVRTPAPPVVGTYWQLYVHAPAGDAVVLALAATAITPTPTLFGMLGIDPFAVAILGNVVLPAQGHDPLATLVLAVPPNPGLVGSSVFVQGIDLLAIGSPRLTNLLAATIQ